MTKKTPLFGLLWLVYFTSNLGRLSYTASMIAIIDSNVLGIAAAGLVGTGFFVCYGMGQLGSGYIGGRLNPHRLIFIGLFCTAFANLAMGFAQTAAAMLVIWCINGLIQSILWPPVLRIIVESFVEPERSKVCFNISTTYPVAVMFAYLTCAGIITVLSWRAVFFFYSIVLLAVSGIWVFAFGKTIFTAGHESGKPAGEAVSLILKNEGKLAEEIRSLPKKEKLKFFAGKYAPGAAIVLFCLALVSQGILRDGLMAWIPAYITRVFSFPTGRAILVAGIIPPINLLGIYLCRVLFARIKDEAKTSACFFGASLLAILLLRFFGEYHISLSLFAFAVIIACMMGINLMFVTFAPARFSSFGLVAFMTGLTNSMVYVGSSISNFGIAVIVENAGWSLLLTLLAVLAMASILFCALAIPKWAAFSGSIEKKETEVAGR